PELIRRVERGAGERAGVEEAILGVAPEVVGRPVAGLREDAAEGVGEQVTAAGDGEAALVVPDLREAILAAEGTPGGRVVRPTGEVERAAEFGRDAGAKVPLDKNGVIGGTGGGDAAARSPRQ